MLARELAQAFAFGAEHKASGRVSARGFQRLGSFLGKPDPRRSRASPSSSKACARFSTRMTGTMSSAPLAALASAPVQRRAVPLGMTRPAAPKAAAERNTAPTFCGSVT